MTTTAPLDGRAYVAGTRLTARDGVVLAAPGDTCERVNPASLPWLLERGHIAPAVEQAAQREDER